MKVLVLFCGGTIIMQESQEGGLVVEEAEKAMARLLELEPKLADVAELEMEYIDNIDSANMSPAHWERMADVIAEKYEDYDGFVITHGTNSMAYTASALSFILEGLGKPVVLTGAQIPSGKIETDGRRNFVNAVRVAVGDLAGVVIVFDEEVILGARSSKVSESKLDAFETINWRLLGEIRIDLRLSDERKLRDDEAELVLKKGFEENIAVVTVVPGTPVGFLEKVLEGGTKGLVLKCYGPGDIGYEYIPVIEKAREMRVPVVVTTQCIEGATLMHVNHVGKKALDAGAIQAYDMSLETVVVKLMWALDKVGYEEIEEVMHRNFVGEINKEGKIY